MGTRKPALENKPSLLLSVEQNDLIFRLIGPRSQSLSTSVIQVLLTDSPSHNRWTKRHCGVACFVRDSQRRSYFIRVFCPDRQIAVWEQELYNGFQYKAPRPYFHTFEGEDCMVGLNFADEEEALRFQNSVEMYLKKKQERRDRKRLSQGNNSNQRPLLQRDNNQNGVQNGSAIVVKQLPPESTKYDSQTKLKKGQKGRKLRKEDIGAPTNFQHVQHVGWDANRGFALEGVDEQLKPFFQMAGITEDQLADDDTRNFIYDFISQRGGVEAAMREVSKPAPPPVPVRGPATPQVNRSAPPPPSRQQAPPPPARVVPVKPPPKAAPSMPSASPGPSPPIATAPPPPPPPPPGAFVSPTAPPPPPMASVPSQPKQSILPVVAQTDSRNALMEAIRGGASLKKVDTAPRKSSVDSRGELLDQIRSGIELKAVSQTDQLPKPAADENQQGLAGALARALAERSRVIQSDSDGGGSSESGEDDDEWD